MPKSNKAIHTLPLLVMLGILITGGYLLNSVKDGKGGAEKEGENPGWFAQWYESKVSADGTIPKWMHAKWAAWDKANVVRRGGEKIIDTVIELGPKSIGGRTRAIWIDPRNENIILAGAVSGGLWRSVNAGATWTAINDQESSLSVSSITSSPFNPDIIYYSTGEGRGNSTDIGGNGIFKSTDGGKTFKVLPSTVGKSGFDVIWKIAHSQTDSNTIYVGTDAQGLFRSTDAGSSWEQVYNGGNHQVTEILTLPNNRLIISMQSSVIVSSDSGGKTGTFVSVNFPSQPGSGQYRRIQLSNCKKYPQVVFAIFEGYAASYTDTPARFYKSSNFGKTWIRKASPTAISSGQQGYCTMIGAHPSDTNYVVAAAMYIAQSSNGGKTWTSKISGHSDHHSYASFSDGTYLVGTDGGVYKYKWTANNVQANLNTGYRVTQFYAGNYGPTGMISISGAQDNGTLVSTGLLTSQKFYGGDGAYAHIGLQDGTIAYLSTQNEGIRRVTGFNASTIPAFTDAINDPLFTTDGVDFINAYTMNPADQTQLYYRTNKKIYRTTSSGDAWDEVAKRAGIKALVTTNEDDPILYFGGTAAQLYKLEKAGSVNISGGYKDVNYNSTIPVKITDDYLKCITVHPKDKYTIFLAFSNFSNEPRIWRASGMDSLKPVYKSVSGNLPPGLPVNSVAVDPAYPDKNLFAGTDYGLYYSTDSGVTWQKDTRVPNVVIFELKMRADRSMFAYTHGRGMFYIGLVGGNGAYIQKPALVNTIKTYPNPANEFIKIDLYGNNVNALFTIYDLNAKVVKQGTLGLSQNKIPVTDMANGYYYLQVKNGTESETHKIAIQH